MTHHKEKTPKTASRSLAFSMVIGFAVAVLIALIYIVTRP